MSVPFLLKYFENGLYSLCPRIYKTIKLGGLTLQSDCLFHQILRVSLGPEKVFYALYLGDANSTVLD